MKTRRAFVIVATGASLVACAAAERKSAEPPSAAPSPSAPANYATAPAQPASGYPMQPGAAPAPPPPQEAPSTADSAKAPSTAATTPPPNRSVALREATSDIESSQRELDAAASDCRGACRALGSMDRAAGNLCRLAESNDEMRRCGDAKTRVYSARDKVRNTCGSCPDVSVDRNAPIPSR